MSVDVHQIAATRLRDLDQRYTPKRRALVEALLVSGPRTIPELLADLAGQAQSSAYRNLTVLEEAGVVHRIVGSGQFARYELAEDLTGHHHHLICSTCGAVDDFTLSDAVERSLEDALRRSARRSRFTATHHRLDLVGTCTRCH
jgi:Fe2+ or Zn2+ uptake regulation protein